MECKGTSDVSCSILRAGFNRYIVECKGGERDIMDVRKELDLIDTLWNVKAVSWYTAGPGSQDLIDTLWNVKNKLV